MSWCLHVHAATDVGCVRQRNEDALCIGSHAVFGDVAWQGNFCLGDGQPQVVAVVDGMGGHKGGAHASRIVAQHLASMAVSEREPSNQLAMEWMSAINAQLYEVADADPGLCGMGATVALLWFGSSGGLSVNVGDARVYRMQDGYLQQRSEDHAVGVAGGPRTLFQAIGGSSKLKSITPAIRAEPLRTGRRYLLCSDGLTDEVDMGTMERLMQQPADEAVQALIVAAREAGGRDNISIIIVELSEENPS